MLRRFRIFAGYPAGMKVCLLKVTALAPMVELSLRVFGLQKTQNLLNRQTPELRVHENESEVVKRYTNAIVVFQRGLPFLSKCLARALTLQYLLARQGIETRVQLGVKKKADGLEGHAWVKYSGEVLVLDFERISDYDFIAATERFPG